MGLFGSELRVTNGFSKTYSEFASETKRAKSDIDSLKGSIKESESVVKGFKNSSNGISDVFKKANNEAGKAFKNIKSDGENSFKSINSSANSLLGTITKLTAGYLSLKGAISGFKTTIGEASNFQNASVFLNAVYGEQQGKQKYKWATNEANNTPFSESEVANGLARAHSLGLKDDAKSFKLLEDLGSYAKVQGVGDLSSAIDAVSDMMGGEFERLKLRPVA